MDYVKNRTHWFGPGAVEIHNGTLSFSEVSYDSLLSGSTNYYNTGFYITTHPNAGSLPSEVNITIDGIKYICPLGGYISYGSDGALSEYKVAVGDSDYIACTATYRGNNALIIFCTAGLINSTFLVEVDTDIYHTIDENFIPSAIKAGRVVEGETFTVDGVEVIAAPGAEIFNELKNNIAIGNCSHAEGSHTTASGHTSHAEGSGTIASGVGSHAEGGNTTASGDHSHAEGENTTASGRYSHTEGWHTTATEDYSHAEGLYTSASGEASHAEGNHATASGYSSHAEGTGTASGEYSHAEGSGTVASGENSHAEGKNTTASGAKSHAEGDKTIAFGGTSHAEGYATYAIGESSHSEGGSSTTIPSTITRNSTSEEVLAAWNEGKFTAARGTYSHAEGYDTLALAFGTHAEGNGTIASGDDSHAEGSYTTASSAGSHAEGLSTAASGNNSHAEGHSTTASGESSHAEGIVTTASGKFSHAEGSNTIASGEASHAQGQYNIEDTANTYAHIVGNGDFATRSNAHTLDWDGNAWFAGDVYVGSTSGTNKDDGSKKLATEEYVDEKIGSGAGGGNVDLSGYVSKNDIIDVAHGGTGKVTHTANAVLTGNGTSAVKNVATASGALYATAANGAPKFGVLPYAQGGTGKALGDVPNYAIMRNAGDGDYMWYIATGNGALYATAANGAPKFGTLPVAQGGTGATSASAARSKLGTNMKLLWTNASPTSTFESFTPLTNSDLAESLANFTAILVWFNITPEATQHSFAIIPIGIGSGTDTDNVKNTTLCFATGDNKWVRRYGWATTSAITFGAGGYKTSLSANWTVNSKYMVPERIYGIR